MIKTDLGIYDLMHGDAVKKIAELNGVGLTEARMILSQMSFSDHRRLSEANITPPSGNTIGPSVTGSQPSPVQQSAQRGKPAQDAPTQQKPMWAGPGTPIQMGMQVGIKGKDGKVVTGDVAQYDNTTKGVTVTNPVTGTKEVYNERDILPPGQDMDDMQPGNQVTTEDVELQRMLKLAGIQEDCSGGATGAGSIAVAPAAMGKVKRRPEAIEEVSDEYTPRSAPKTVVGDVAHKPSDTLSANMAHNKGKSAARPAKPAAVSQIRRK